MRELRQVAPALMLLTVAAQFASARPVQGQSVLERTPNLAAGWIGTEGTVYFNFLHRFWKVDADEDKIPQLTDVLPGRSPA